MLVSLPKPLTNGTTAFGSDVRANDDSIVSVVNGGLDNDNARTGADAAGKGFTSDKYADASITTPKLADGSVTAVKEANDLTLGNGANLSELYTGAGSDLAGGYPSTNVLATRKQRGGKTIWAYFGIVIANLNVNYLIDNSHDWRRRLIAVMSEATTNTATPKGNIPGGASDDQTIGYPGWTAGPLPGTGGNFGMFYGEEGQDGTIVPGSAGGAGLDILYGNGNYTVRWFVGSGGGGTIAGSLYARATAIQAQGIAVNAKIDCSPSLGT